MQVVLDGQGLKDVGGVAYRQMGAVGVIGSVTGLLGGGDDVGVELHIVFGQPVGGGLGRSGLQVIEITVHLLIVGEALTHMVENILGKSLGFRVG